MSINFQSNLRGKSSEQLLNMLGNKASWSDEQFKHILSEINNREISTIEIKELNETLKKDILSEEQQSEFEQDMEIINEAEVKEIKQNRFHLIALYSGLILTFFMAFTLFDGFSLLGVVNDYTNVYLFVFIEYLIVIIIWFFVVWGLFLGEKYLLSIIANAGLGLFLIVMSWISF